MAATQEKPNNNGSLRGDILPIVFGTARYGARKINGQIKKTRGTRNLDAHLLLKGIQRGYNFIDTAQSYGASELVVRRALGDIARDEIVIATKVGAKPEEDIAGSIERSVRRLGTEPDVLYVHDRWEGILNGAMDDCLQAVDDAVDRGLVQAVGISNFEPEELRYAIEHLRHPVEFYQAKVNLHKPRLDAGELLAICRAEGILFTASSALDRGQFMQEPGSELAAIAARYDMTLAQLAIVGLRSLDMYPVVMTKNAQHMDENKAALALSIDEADAARLGDILLSRP